MYRIIPSTNSTPRELSLLTHRGPKCGFKGRQAESWGTLLLSPKLTLDSYRVLHTKYTSMYVLVSGTSRIPVYRVSIMTATTDLSGGPAAGDPDPQTVSVTFIELMTDVASLRQNSLRRD